MTREQIDYMSKVPLLWPSQKIGLWKKAFDEYNNDHKEERPMLISCMSCYRKVYFYLRKKYHFE